MIKYISKLLTTTFLLLLFVSFSLEPNNSLFDSKELSPPFEMESSVWVDSVFNTLSLDEKIGQLFIVAAYSNLGDNHEKEIEELIKKYKIGGLIFFQ